MAPPGNQMGLPDLASETDGLQRVLHLLCAGMIWKCSFCRLPLLLLLVLRGGLGTEVHKEARLARLS